MADEITPPPAPDKVPAVSSIRFKNEAQGARFMKVLAWRIAKGKSANASDFIWQMFEYIEKNPYSDFPTGR